MTRTRSATAPNPPRKATLVREYGPLPVERVHGLTHDGSRVWFARGRAIAAMNLDIGAIERELEVPADAAFDGEHLLQIGDDAIRKVDPKDGRVVATIPVPGLAKDNSGLA